MINSTNYFLNFRTKYWSHTVIQKSFQRFWCHSVHTLKCLHSRRDLIWKITFANSFNCDFQGLHIDILRHFWILCKPNLVLTYIPLYHYVDTYYFQWNIVYWNANLAPYLNSTYIDFVDLINVHIITTYIVHTYRNSQIDGGYY